MNGPAARPGAPVAILPMAAGRGRAGPVWWVAAVPLAVFAVLWALLNFLLSLAGRPGVSFERRFLRAVPGIPTDTGQAFIVGFAETGPATGYLSPTTGKGYTELASFGDYEDVYGGRSSVYAVASDAVEAAFAEGVSTVYFGRVLGAAPVVATLALSDGTGTGMTINALYPGALGNDLSVTVTAAGGNFTIEVRYLDVLVETYATNATVAAAVTALAASAYVRGVAGTGVDPVAVADTNLATGADDNAAASDATWLAALNLFPAELGPGQVYAPGRTTLAAWEDVADHTIANNRIGMLDNANAASAGTVAAAAAAFGTYAGAERCFIGANRATIPQAVAGVDRVAVASALVSGLIARSDALYDAGTWPIGDNGRLRYALAATSEFTDAERTTLTAAGVNVFLDDPNGLRLYGFRSASSDPLYANLGHQRLMMAFEAQARQLAEGFVGKRITNAVITDFQASLEGLAMAYYTDGALYGDTASDAFRIVTASPINTAATAALRELNAECYLRFSENVELVRIVATVVPVTSTVAA